MKILGLLKAKIIELNKVKIIEKDDKILTQKNNKNDNKEEDNIEKILDDKDNKLNEKDFLQYKSEDKKNIRNERCSEKEKYEFQFFT